MVALAVDAFERVRARFVLFGFETERVDLEIGLAVPSKVAVIFSFVRTIAFQTSSTLKLACKGCVPLLLTVLVL